VETIFVFIMEVKIKKPKKVSKRWGYELWIHNESDYCGKLLVFTESGNKFSMHYHMIKDETWFIQSGKFQFDWIDTKTGSRLFTFLEVGDVIEIKKGLPHQLIALEDDSVVFEVSTEHFDEDSYRVYIDTYNDLK
jgi:mannose-6-phosphate isomerase-like protein (cupin superfamily)